jgi:hypothetical protein
MNGDVSEDMDKAWREYVTSLPVLAYRATNPRNVFEAGWLAAVNNGQIRASGWTDGED